MENACPRQTMLFLVSILGMMAVVPIHFLSVEHLKLERKYGQEKGRKVGSFLGMLSGWGFFGFWVIIWVSSQPRFGLPVLQDLVLVVPIISIQIPLAHLLIGLPLVTVGAWLGIAGVRAISLRAAETHRSEKIVKTGVYAYSRHPQYLGGLISHLGVTFIMSGLCSLLVSPIVILLNYLISWKEEKELVREFGSEYDEYKKSTSMLLPKIRARAVTGNHS